MAETEPLRRLGGGRWQTKDGRFTIEPQAGTWMVVDAERTDDLGLALVRGPYRSLGAARSAIDGARQEGDVESPLAERVAAAKAKQPPRRKREASKAARRPPGRSDQTDEPTWLTSLAEERRRKARDLLRRLDRAGIPDAEAIARAEFVHDEPAVARVALERRVRSLVGSTSEPEALGRALLKLVTSGEDATLGAGWRLVDSEGRPITGTMERRRRR